MAIAEETNPCARPFWRWQWPGILSPGPASAQPDAEPLECDQAECPFERTVAAETTATFLALCGSGVPGKPNSERARNEVDMPCGTTSYSVNQCYSTNNTAEPRLAKITVICGGS